MRKLKEAFGGRRREGQISSSDKVDQQRSSQSSTEDSFARGFPDGVEVLHDCPNATIDICFVHGLTGDRITTWTTQGQSDPWPKTLLPPRLSTARILTYGYDAYWVRRSVAGSNHLIDHATNLLNDLTTDRDLNNAASRPIIFVAHSLGGLVCKKAILRSRNNPDVHLRSIFDSTKGVIFMGTPHKGSWMADWAKISAGALGLVKSINKSLLDILRTSNQFLEAIQVDFWSMIRELRESGRRIEVICFFEELPLSVVGQIVSKESATLEGYNAISIHANHRDMVRFSSANDNGFKRLLGVLVRWESDTRPLYIMNENDRQCLKSLWPTDPTTEKIRIQQTKGGLLEDVYCWVFENPDFRRWRDDKMTRLLWIRGDPGKGKTMLVCGIIDYLKQSIKGSELLSFFFCQAADSRINNATAVLCCLIRQLVDQQPSLISHIRKRHDAYEDINSWYIMSQIFTDILKDGTMRSTFLLIDGLDECQTGLPELLSMIMQNWSSYSHVKWIISSRNYPSITERLDTAEQLSLELNAESISSAVGLYIDYKSHDLARLKKYTVHTHNAVRQHLSTNAEGTFLWVALLCQYLERVHWDPMSKIKRFPPGLDSLYQRMFEEIRGSEEDELCRELLGFMTAAYRPIGLQELASFSKSLAGGSKDNESLKEAINLCGSFLTTRGGTVFFVHQSAKEFLTEKASIELFPLGTALVHHTIFSRSLSNLKQTLRRDIYSLCCPGFPIEKVECPDPDPLGPVQYSCIYWVDHLSRCYNTTYANYDLQEGGLVEGFLTQRYLYWIEALSLLRCMSQGITAISKLDGLLRKTRRPLELVQRVQDACRFMRYHRLALESSPLQVYYSALIFSPIQSTTRKCFQKEKLDLILSEPTMEDNWNPCLHQMLEGHSKTVFSISWSPDGSLLASGSFDNTVRIWDPATGQCTLTLQGHSKYVWSISWSPDGGLLASCSSDKTIKIWNPSTAQCTLTLKGHNKGVYSIKWSPDGALLASSSFDMTIKIWNPITGHCISTVEGRRDVVKSTASWSPDGNRLASVLEDKTIRIWDLASRDYTWTLKGHREQIASVSWAPNGNWLASSGQDSTVRIWDLTTGKPTTTLEGHSDPVNPISWSPDGSLLASGSPDHTVKLWNPTTGQCTLTLKGHNKRVYSVKWSPDGALFASSSVDKTIKIWNPVTGQCTSTLKGHCGMTISIAWSPDGSRLASGSDDKTVRVWDPAVGQNISAVEGHSDDIYSISFSADRSRLASGSEDRTIRIWDATTGKCVSTLEGHTERVISIAWAPDGSRLASGAEEPTMRIWDTDRGRCTSTLRHHNWVTSIDWSPDGRWLASGSFDRIVRIWDVASGHCISALEGHIYSIWSVAWSHDGSQLASGAQDDTIRLWDPSNRQCTTVIKGHTKRVWSLTWSHDGNRLASASMDDTIRIWDPRSGQCTLTLDITEPHSLQFDMADVHHLHTNIGTFNVESAFHTPEKIGHSAFSAKQVGYGLRNDRSWITFKGKDFLWIPSEYRPGHSSLFTTCGKATFVIGCPSGRLLILMLSEGNLVLQRNPFFS
ncbi:WD40-repeat-containing domain protein [Aspergillus terricola var. indicus]